MRVFIAVLILIFSLQSWTKADDIRDFEIEGISIGDSLLDHMNINQIKNARKTYYPNKKNFEGIFVTGIVSKIYDSVGVDYENTSNLYKIHSVQGFLYFNKDINTCYEQKKKIVLELTNLFANNSTINSYKRIYAGDETGSSKSDVTDFHLDNGSTARVMCIDWGEKLNEKKQDFLQVVINSSEFQYYLMNEAFK